MTDKLMPASHRRSIRSSRPKKHVRYGPQRDSSGDRVLWHTTGRRPWVMRAERRAANKRARAARRVNR